MRATRSCSIISVSACVLGLLAAPAHGAPLSQSRVESGVDWTSAGVGGVGGGRGVISLGGVSGPVRQAFLYWNGIDQLDPDSDGVYDNEAITFAGHPIVGTPVGDSHTNCWGAGSSRTFRADVTPFVSGNGPYTVSGLSAKPRHSANGASLIVFFDDGSAADDRDVVVFDGNDSNVASGFPGEDDGWHAVLDGIQYSGGSVNAQLHVADGQTFEDDSLTFSTTARKVTVPDTTSLWDGASVTDAGTSRAMAVPEPGSLWDIHSFVVTGAFGASGPYTLSVDGQEPADDCLSLVVLLLDFPAGAVTATTTTTTTSTTSTTMRPGVCGNGSVERGEACDLGGANGTPGACCTATCTFRPAGQECRPAADACDAAETCDGTTAACPPDEVRPAGAVCRPAADPCDREEVCDGIGLVCPPDTKRAVGEVCDDGDPETGIASCNDALACTGVSTVVVLQPENSVPATQPAKRVRIPMAFELMDTVGTKRARAQAQGLVDCLDLPPDVRPKKECGSLAGVGGGYGARLQSVLLRVTPKVRRSLGRTQARSVPVGLPLTKLGRRLFAKLGSSQGGLQLRIRCLLRDRRGRRLDVTAPTVLRRQR